MSWSFAIEPVEYAGVAKALDEAAAAQIAGIGRDWPDDDQAEQRAATKGQIIVAAAAAKTIAASGVIGPPGCHLVALLSGHANPGHGSREGYAKDAVTVTVYQETPPTVVGA